MSQRYLEIAYRKGFISRDQLAKLATRFKSVYGQYLSELLANEDL